MDRRQNEGYSRTLLLDRVLVEVNEVGEREFFRRKEEKSNFAPSSRVHLQLDLDLP